MTTRAGKLRHRVRVYSFTVVRDAQSNEEVRTPVLQTERWAEILEKTVGEREIADQQQSIATHEIEMRQITVDSDWYFEWDDPVYGYTRTFNPVGNFRPSLRRGVVKFPVIEVMK